MRLMWSSMTMMSPTLHWGCIPPQALDTIRISTPRAFITRTGIGDLPEVIALVGVEAAAHRHDLMPLQLTEHELAVVALHGAGHEVGDVVVGDDRRVIHVLAEAGEAGAEDDADPRPDLAGAASDECDRLLDLRVEVLHGCFPLGGGGPGGARLPPVGMSTKVAS